MHKVETEADAALRECLAKGQSFALIAGAGSGKTSSLVDALEQIRNSAGPKLRRNGQRVACITYTNRAVEVINERLDFDSLFAVSTLHSFLWDQVGRFQSNISEVLRFSRLPTLIAKEREKDTGGTSRAAIRARDKADRLEQELAAIEAVDHFEYSDANFSDYSKGQLSHDDIIAIASHLLEGNATFRRITALRFPYIFIDEAQDTFAGIVTGLNLVAEGPVPCTVGYFGDPWQQIYEDSVGEFAPPASGRTVSKIENFRCSESVIRLLNAFRDDVKQMAAGKNKGREGSVVFRLVQAEDPELPRKRYSDEQVERALASMDAALRDWGWSERQDVVKLFLVRQMIAKRMGFVELNRLFNGEYASSRAQDLFVSGEHFLLTPLTGTIYPLITAYEEEDNRRVIDILRREGRAFDPDGPNALKTLRAMIDLSSTLVKQLSELWQSGTIREVLQFCLDKEIVRTSEKLLEHIKREPRAEQYDEEVHSIDKGDWLADSFFAMDTCEIPSYKLYISDHTAYSTQHGVKGEQYPKVLVVYDDTEASWSHYNFAKLFTPQTAGGEPTDGQRDRGRKLAYVNFSRAEEDLRVLFFTPDPERARDELISKKLLEPEQVQVVLLG